MYKYDPRLEIQLIEKYFYKTYAADQFLGEIGKYRDIHAGGTLYEGTDEELVIPKVEEYFTIEQKIDDIKNYNIEAFSIHIFEHVRDRIGRIQRELLNSISKITGLTGKAMDAKGKKLSPDLMLEMLETVYIPFDENGTPIMPTFFASPQMVDQVAKWKETKEDMERLQGIIENKKREFYAKKRYRRLSYID